MIQKKFSPFTCMAVPERYFMQKKGVDLSKKKCFSKDDGTVTCASVAKKFD